MSTPAKKNTTQSHDARLIERTLENQALRPRTKGAPNGPHDSVADTPSPFRTPDGSVISPNGELLYMSGERFRRDIVEGDCCFLCGVSPSAAPFTDEHVIPDWALRECSLHQKKVTLANGASIPYSKYRVQCCAACNEFLGTSIEVPISTLIKKGHRAVGEFLRSESPWLVFAWMNLLFLKTHLKDRALRFSLDARNGSENIADFYDWGPMHHIHCVVRALRTGAQIDHSIIGSLFVLPAKVRPHLESFDYSDFSFQKAMLVRIGETAIIAVLDDACATLSLLREWLLPKLGGPLSPVQLREILARCAHANAAVTTRPQFRTTFERGVPRISVTHPEHLEAEMGDPELLGRLMDQICTPLVTGYAGDNKGDVVAGIKSGKWTFLVDADGNFDALSMEPAVPKG